MFTFDHIVLACSELSSACRELETCIGLPLTQEGKHTHFRTHNHLLSLGESCYLELIAIDPTVANPDHPRWFALDSFSGPMRPTHWAVRCDDLDAAMTHLPKGDWQRQLLRRDIYKWDIALGADGHQPLDETAPVAIQWKSPRPAEHLPDHGARLVSLTLSHPTPDALPKVSTPEVSYVKGAPGISFTIRAANGDITF